MFRYEDNCNWHFGPRWFFLSQLLLSKGYEVHDVLTRNSLMSGGTMELQPLDIRKQMVIHYGDITDENFLSKLLLTEQPEEFFILLPRVLSVIVLKMPTQPMM